MSTSDGGWRRWSGRGQVRAGLSRAIATEPPADVGHRWRDALAAEPRWRRSGVSVAGAKMVRPLALSAATLTTAVVILIGLSLVFPTVALYAGSVPGLGPVFHVLGLDRGLRLAYDLNLAVRVDREVTDGEVAFRVHGLVADNIRTVMDYEVRLPAELWAEMQGGEPWPAFSGIRWWVTLSDQWGHRYGWRPFWEMLSDPPQTIGDTVIYRGNQKFMPVELRTKRMTAGIFVLKPGLEFETFETIEDFSEAMERLALRLTFPVDFSAAASRSRVFHPNVSDEIDGVRVTLLEVRAGATATQYRLAVEGLSVGAGTQLREYIDLATYPTDDYSTDWHDGELTITVRTPLTWSGTHTILLAAAKARTVDLSLPLRLGADGRPVPATLSLGGMEVTLESWTRSEDRLELEFSGKGPGSYPLGISAIVAIPGGDSSVFHINKERYSTTATFHMPSRGPGIWLSVPAGEPDPEEIRIVAVLEDLSRLLELKFEVPK